MAPQTHRPRSYRTAIDTPRLPSELGRARSDAEGRFDVARSGAGRPRLLVVQASGAAHARFLGDDADHLDLDLDRVAGAGPSRAGACRPGPGEHGEADLVR